VSARDPTDANALVLGGWYWHGQSARTPVTGITSLSGIDDVAAVMRFPFSWHRAWNATTERLHS
jgi:hypothetical protein